MDRWRLVVTPARTVDDTKAKTLEKRLLDAVLGPEGLNLWNAAAGRWGYLSVAPVANRVPAMIRRNNEPQLGQVGDDPLTVEALKHTLRRANVVVVFSPSLASQIVARALLVGLDKEGDADGGWSDVPLAMPKALATFSMRLSETDVTARCHVPVAELEAVVAAWRTVELFRAADGRKGE